MTTIPGFEVYETLYESERTIVYRARQSGDQRSMVLKLPKIRYARPEDIARYKREHEITSRLDRKHVIHSLSINVVRNQPVMVLEDFGGSSLLELLPGSAWSLAERLKIAISICEGLIEIHACNIIHKNINPGNIIINQQTSELKIIDFGISSSLARENPSTGSAGMLEGSLPYISPEQTGRMNRMLDYRSDFYSLGVTLYQLFGGELPFAGEDALELVHRHMTQEPVSLHNLNPDIPEVLSNIITRLLAKTAEERYQSAYGIKSDLDKCLTGLQKQGHIEPFTLGTQDSPSQFILPQKLYGRAVPISRLMQAFQLAKVGGRQLLLVTGYSGIGKTSLVHEIYKPITQERGYFVTGKFDQLQKNIPYSALVIAFRELVRQILTESESDVLVWQQRLLDALGKNGRVIIDVIPEVELIIGGQEPLPDLPPSESQNRLYLTFRKFIQVFCQPGRPLVVFLDDLQWADRATLRLLNELMTDEEAGYLLLIGAYRDNEIDGSHPLSLMVEDLERHGAGLEKLVLSELSLQDITNLVADSLRTSLDKASVLANLVYEKTGGNPFFVGQFLNTIHQAKHISFDPANGDNKTAEWRFDIQSIRGMAITDNVVDLMISKLMRLPGETVEVLCRASCLGNHFDLETLSIICESSPQETYSLLLAAISEGIVMPLGELTLMDSDDLGSQLAHTRFKLLHDRVQQAAYAMIDTVRRPQLHWKIGRLLWPQATDAPTAERIFEVADHLNLGADLVESTADKISLAVLNLEAARKAKSAGAYAAALRYLQSAMDRFEGDWQGQYKLTHDLFEERAETEYLNGNYENAEAFIAQIWEHSSVKLDRASAYTKLVTQRTVLGKNDEAIAAAAQALSLLNLEFPNDDELDSFVQIELTKIEEGLKGRTIASLIDLPAMTDERIKVVLKVLMTVHTTAYFANRYRLYSWVLAKMTSLSMAHGNVPESSKGYASFGNTIAANLGRYQDGYEFGLLGLRLAEKYEHQSLSCKAAVILGMFLTPWTKPVSESEALDHLCERAGMESGEFQFIGYLYSYSRLVNRLHGGTNLGELLSESRNSLIFTRRARHNLSTDIILAGQLIIASLQKICTGATVFALEQLSEESFLENCTGNGSFAALAFFYAYQSFVHYLMGEFDEAQVKIDKALELIGYIKGIFTQAEVNFFHSLILCANYPHLDKVRQASCLEQIRVNQKQMRIWADNCPANFEHRWILVEAELKSIDQDMAAAIELYDQAVNQAKDCGFTQNEALANELAAKFWLGHKKNDFAAIYLEKARSLYTTWGAHAKAARLERQYIQLPLPPVQPNLDMITVFKASQAIAGEVVLERLLKTLMSVVLEAAGAQTGALLLQQNADLIVRARAYSADFSASPSQGETNAISIDICDLKAADCDFLPDAVINYVRRVKETVVIAEAVKDATFGRDLYFQKRRPRSVLCLPILKHSVLVGILYLENNLAGNVFTSARVGLLQLLSFQVVTSLENGLLFDGLNREVGERRRAEEALRQSEEQFRATFELAAVGKVQIEHGTGRHLRVNAKFCEMLGYSQDELLQMTATDITHEDDLGEAIKRFRGFLDSGQTDHSFELRYRRKNGEIIWVEGSAALLRDDSGKPTSIIAVIQDITNRKLVEADVQALNQELEERVRLRTIQLAESNQELALAKEVAEEANRKKSEFVANLSHEIRTPMNAVIGMSDLLSRTRLDMEQKEHLETIQLSAEILLQLIDDILDYSKIEARKLQLEKVDFDLVHLAQNSMQVLAGKARQKQIATACFVEVVEELQWLSGDSARLRQVLINLIGNAIKFTESGFIDLSVRAAKVDNHVEVTFSVRDSGIGMTAETIQNLFMPFTQADGSITRRYGGTGLGLTISKHMVEIMGGVITVESVEGVGSTFSFTVPLELARMDGSAPALPPPFPRRRSQPRDERILLVEDNPTNRKLALLQLNELGFEADSANNGIQALVRVGGRAYDLILMDCQMPEMDGFEATRTIRRLEHELKRENTIIVAMTAQATAADREACFACGMDAYLSKPVTAAKLQDALMRWLPTNKMPDGNAYKQESGSKGGSDTATDEEADDPGLCKRRFAEFADELGDEACLAFVEAFTSDLKKLIAELGRPLSFGQADRVKSTAHQLKGVLLSFNALHAAGSAQRLEYLCADENWPEIEREYERLVEHVQELLSIDYLA